MIAALHMAGFDVFDVTMSDILGQKITLDQVRNTTLCYVLTPDLTSSPLSHLPPAMEARSAATLAGACAAGFVLSLFPPFLLTFSLF